MKEILIGKQIWMSENLNVNFFQNGDVIREVRSFKEWNAEESACCYYNNNNLNGEKYGKLYNGFAVRDPKGLAPKGWHIPTKSEWLELINYLGNNESGVKLKSMDKWNGNNKSGFNALPSGFRMDTNVITSPSLSIRIFDYFFEKKHGCTGLGELSGFWSSSENDSFLEDFFMRISGLICFRLNTESDIMFEQTFFGPEYFSVRCIKD